MRIKPGMKVFDGKGTQWAVIDVDETEKMVTLEGCPYLITETRLESMGTFWSLFTILEQHPLVPKPKPTCITYKGRHIPID